MKHSLALASIFVGTSALVGCGSDPADIAGEYSANLTSRDNGCSLANWQEGGTASQIPVTITQEGDSASADVGGLARVVLDLAIGAHVFTGDVDGSSFELEIIGTRPQTSGNCTYTFNATLDGKLNGDSISGRLSFSAATNDNSDCAALEGCVSFQEFAASRAPR